MVPSTKNAAHEGLSEETGITRYVHGLNKEDQDRRSSALVRSLTRKLIQPKMEFFGFLCCSRIYQRTALESSLQANCAAGRDWANLSAVEEAIDKKDDFALDLQKKVRDIINSCVISSGRSF